MEERCNRRQFLERSATVPLASWAATRPLSNGSAVRAGYEQSSESHADLIWANLLHLGRNMWEDRAWAPDMPERLKSRCYSPDLEFDEALWNELLPEMKSAGMNMVVIDLADAIRYESHPEIAVNGAWSVVKLKEELGKVREMGLEPIPKLNFSTAHDAWLGEYSRMVSTARYRAVVQDLIAEVIELFDRPRFFHLGMDEETAQHQRYYEFMVVRQYELWWRDIQFYFEQVEAGGSRPWVWSDYYWHHPETFLKNMPKTVIQSNWYYGTAFETEPEEQHHRVLAYRAFDDNGYDQMPTGSNHSRPENFGLTVEYCQQHIDPARLLGFFQTPWRKTTAEYRAHHLEAIRVVAEARQQFLSGTKG